MKDARNMRTYEAWMHANAGGQDVDEVSLIRSEHVQDMRDKGLLDRQAKLLYRFDAATAEEASSIHNLRMGWGPYSPIGEPAPCPRCGAWYYPESSADCWRCGPVR